MDEGLKSENTGAGEEGHAAVRVGVRDEVAVPSLLGDHGEAGGEVTVLQVDPHIAGVARALRIRRVGRWVGMTLATWVTRAMWVVGVV